MEGKRREIRREGGSKQGKERGEDKKMKRNTERDTRREVGREQEKRKGEYREMEGRTSYTVMSKHILKGNEWFTHLLFMRIRSARSICKICSLASESDNKS